MQFTELNLAPYILRALDEMGYEDMTPIQEQTIPPHYTTKRKRPALRR